MKLLLTGVTGAAGIQIFRAAVADPSVTNITVLSRRPLPDWTPQSSKTDVVVLKDFLDYPPELLPKLAGHDACIWALGTSSSGHTEESYTTITFGYVEKAVDAIVQGKKNTGDERSFKFVYVSGEGADPSGKTMMMFGRIKGRTEKLLVDLPPSSHIKASIIRPSYFFPTKEDQHIRSTGSRVLNGIMTPVLSTVLPSFYTPVEGLATFALELAKGKWSDETTFTNKRMRELLKVDCKCDAKTEL